jgi:hypothetical protein
MLRVAGSLITNQVRAYDLLRMLTRDGYPTPLGQALAEYERIAKTLHLLGAMLAAALVMAGLPQAGQVRLAVEVLRRGA